MSKALNTFFAAIYLIVFIVSAGICLYYAVANNANFTSYGDGILYAFLVLIGTLCSSAIHWDARDTKKIQLRHRVFLGVTIVNFISFVWLAATIVNCGEESCASQILVPLITTIFVWIITFSYGVTLFMKFDELNLARMFAGLFSVGALFWSFNNLRQDVPLWPIPMALAVLGIVCVIFAPYITKKS